MPCLLAESSSEEFNKNTAGPLLTPGNTMNREGQMSLNPQKQIVTIGKKELETITLWPLSIPDQQSMGEEIQVVLKRFFEFKDNEEETDNKIELELARLITDVVKKNLGILLALATCEEDEDVRSGAKQNPLLNKITNLQAIDIGEIVYKQNYGDALGKIKSLIPKKIMEKVMPGLS